MTIIEPIEMTDGMVGSGAGTVPEVEYPEWSATTSYNAFTKVIVKGTEGVFVTLVTVGEQWNAMTVAPNGDVYACSFGGEIWIQTGGIGPFVSLGSDAPDHTWTALAATPNGDIYACTNGQGSDGVGEIWKRSGGTGAFQALSQGDKVWVGMAATPNGDVYACVYAGSIWKQTGGTGNFVDLAALAGTKNWYGMTAALNGDVYASVDGGSIWKQTGGAGNFVDLAVGTKGWRHLAINSAGDIYAAVNPSGLWKQTGGVGSFVNIVSGAWIEAVASSVIGNSHSVYYCMFTGVIKIFTFSGAHKIYESLVNANLSNYPPLSVEQTTPKWLEYSSTNKWKPFDGKVNSQMATPSPAIYVITPGVAHDSIALLNLVATTVRVQGTSGAYDTSITTGATDIVLTNLAGLAANVLTITITNTAGQAKCGEIIVGNSYSLGTMQPLPTVGITDYSTKEADVFGDWNIVPRESSEKMSCVISVPYASLDAVIAKLKSYRSTPIVFIGNAGYACTIIYGFIKDWSVPVATRGKSIMALEIDGLT